MPVNDIAFDRYFNQTKIERGHSKADAGKCSDGTDAKRLELTSMKY